MTYFPKEDILHLVISKEEEANSIELSPNITAELNEKGELIGIEILKASAFEEEGGWIGWLDKYPDHWTQGDSLDDLKEHLKGLHEELASTNGLSK